jgi:carbamoyl-phosphate synthase large subunit
MSSIESKEITMTSNLLVTSISRKAPLLKLVRSALERSDPGARLVGGDCDPECLGRHFVDDFWHMPPLPQLSYDYLADICRRRGITRIIPTRDGELPFFARWRSCLEEKGIRTMVSLSEAIEACLDKRLFTLNLQTLDIPVVPFLESPKEGGASALVVKERFGSGSRGIGVALSSEEAERWASAMECPLIQPYLEGQEFSIDVYVDGRGRAKGAVVRSRDRVVAGESLVTTTCPNRFLAELSCRAAEGLGLYGHVVFQGIETEEGFFFIECNPRFGGASTLSVKAGLDSFYWFLREAAGEDISRHVFQACVSPLRQVRYPEDLVVSL